MEEIGKCAAIVEKIVEKIIAVICFSSSFDIKHPTLSRALRTPYCPILGLENTARAQGVGLQGY